MKNIAIFTNDLKVGGIQKSIINLLNNIDKKKYNVDLYIFDSNNFYTLPNKINIIYLQKPKSIYKFLPFNLVKKLMKINVKPIKYDLAIDFDSYQMHTAIGALSCNASKRAIWIHNDIQIKKKEEIKYKILYFFFQKKYEYFNAYCAVSEGALDSFKKIKNYKNKEYLVIPNFIDTAEIKTKMYEKCDININKELINIVTVGRLCHQKGIDIMLHNIKQLTETRRNFHLYIIGDGPDKEKLKKLVEKLNIKNYITFLGNRTNPYKYLKMMDIFYLSSRYEGQGMVVLEALSVGCDILIPKHLEKYCPPIKGKENIIEYFETYKKRKKNEFNNLKEYNEKVINSIYNLFDK